MHGSQCFERRADGVLLDLGAHLGAATKWFLEPRPDAASTVDYYEPGSTVDLLSNNMKNDTRVTVHKIAVRSVSDPRQYQPTRRPSGTGQRHGDRCAQIRRAI